MSLTHPGILDRRRVSGRWVQRPARPWPPRPPQGRRRQTSFRERSVLRGWFRGRKTQTSSRFSRLCPEMKRWCSTSTSLQGPWQFFSQGDFLWSKLSWQENNFLSCELFMPRMSLIVLEINVLLSFIKNTSKIITFCNDSGSTNSPWKVAFRAAITYPVSLLEDPRQPKMGQEYNEIYLNNLLMKI